MVTPVSVKSTAPHLLFKQILARASDVVATARSDHLVR
jgi:hypothetical protein